MNFEFSDDQKLIQDQARSFLAEHSPLSRVRNVLERDSLADNNYDQALWKGLLELGWAGVAIPESYGGLGMGYLELCVIAEEMGRSLAAVPFSSSVYLAAEAILIGGTEVQKQQWLPKIASGEVIASVAFAESRGGMALSKPSVSANSAALLTGSKLPVCDGAIADLLLVSASNPDGKVAWYLVTADANGLTNTPLNCIDPSRSMASLTFDNTPAEPMSLELDAQLLQADVLDRAAVLFAFEQVGGAQACLDMAREYTTQRYAFGRPIGSFQALKHKMADMFVAIELARSNAYYGAWALSSGASNLTEAAAVARISATDAYYECSKENMQAHGGMGYTWELDCHLYYRRAQYLASLLGSQAYWKDRLMEEVA
ncbi:MAG: acyl-CoA dehydrogenase family protein [Pseudomonadales bacterium]